MLKAGQIFKFQGGNFSLYYDTPEIKGTSAEGMWTDSAGNQYERRTSVENLKPYLSSKAASHLQYSIEIKVDTSELDAAIAKLEKLQELEKATEIKAAVKEIISVPPVKKIYTKSDLYVGLTFPYLAPFNSCQFFYKIIGFSANIVFVHDCYSTGEVKSSNYSLTVDAALERLNQETN